jgi:hypothetical protein
MKRKRQTYALKSISMLAFILLVGAVCAAYDKVLFNSYLDYRSLRSHDGHSMRGARIDLSTQIFTDLQIPY